MGYGLLRGGLRQRTIGRAALASRMGDHTLLGHQIRHCHTPALGRCRLEHLARCGARLAHHQLRTPRAPAAAGAKGDIHLVTRQVLVDRCELHAHIFPAAFQFFGQHHGQAGAGALAHFGPGDFTNDLVVRRDADPGVDINRATVRAIGCEFVGGCRRQVKTQAQARASCHGGVQKATA